MVTAEKPAAPGKKRGGGFNPMADLIGDLEAAGRSYKITNTKVELF